MATIVEFTELKAWQFARALTNDVYARTRLGDFAKDFALRDQIRRSAISIPSNIAEGFDRGGSKEFSNFLSIAMGSCGELEAQLFIAFDQAYISESEFGSLRDQVKQTKKLCGGLMKYLRKTDVKGIKFSPQSGKQSDINCVE